MYIQYNEYRLILFEVNKKKQPLLLTVTIDLEQRFTTGGSWNLLLDR